MFIPKDEVIIY